MSEVFSLDFPPRAEWFATARLFVGAAARLYGCSESSVDDLKLVISEACNNAVEAFEGSDELARITVTPQESEIRFHIRGGGHASLLGSSTGAGEDPETWELAGILGAELIRALFADASVEPGEAGRLDLEISVPVVRGKDNS